MLLRVSGVLSANSAADRRLAITCRDNSVFGFNAGGHAFGEVRQSRECV